MRVLFIFLDGVGLGSSDPEINPFVRAKMPHLNSLLGGKPMVIESVDSTILETKRASLLALDACLGVAGLPQSATGQAALLTGQNVPGSLGYHYGPKPNPPTAAFLRQGTIFHHTRKAGVTAALLNAYPPRYFDAIDSGRRLFSAIPMAVTQAGLELKTTQDLQAGRAISADFTAQGWQKQLGVKDIPVLAPIQAGHRLAQLSQEYVFTFFEYWLSDYAGHGQDMQEACALLENLDQVLGGLLDVWEDQEGLVLITSDHGNLEDLSTRKHTTNPVPALLIGTLAARQSFTKDLKDLTGIAPRILNHIGI